MPLNYQWSYWEFNSFFKDIDYCIVGSGIVGLSAAIHLKLANPAAQVVVLERGILPIGANTRNAGFACFGSTSELLDDLSNTSEAEVWALVEQRYQGLLALRTLLGDEAIGYLPEGGYEIFNQADKSTQEACLDAIPSFNQRLKSITGMDETFTVVPKSRQTQFGFAGVDNMVLNQAEGCIDTGKMMRSLLFKAQQLGILILNHCEVANIYGNRDEVDIMLMNGWTFSARKLILATNGFTKELFPELVPSIDIRPARNQVLITEPIPGLALRGCFHYDRGYFYFRNVGDRVLLGGGRHLDFAGETTAEFGTNPVVRKALIELLENVILPGQSYQVERWWTGILGVSQHKKPIIEKNDDHLILAVRMGGMGVAIGTLVGKKAAELALKD